MTKTIQIVGCVEDLDEGEVHPFVADEHADYFSLYLGEPGAYLWLADFANKGDAELFAAFLAQTYGYTIDDQTFTNMVMQ